LEPFVSVSNVCKREVRAAPRSQTSWEPIWNAVYELLPRDACGNVTAPTSICLDSHNNFVDARGKVVALLGVRDLIVVDTPDALLVAARDHAQRVGEIVKALEKLERHDPL
jgi:hypothetical protein